MTLLLAIYKNRLMFSYGKQDFETNENYNLIRKTCCLHADDIYLSKLSSDGEKVSIEFKSRHNNQYLDQIFRFNKQCLLGDLLKNKKEVLLPSIIINHT